MAKKYTFDELKELIKENCPNPLVSSFDDLFKYEDEETILAIANGDKSFDSWEFQKKIENIERDNAMLQMKLLKEFLDSVNSSNTDPNPHVGSKKKAEQPVKAMDVLTEAVSNMDSSEFDEPLVDLDDSNIGLKEMLENFNELNIEDQAMVETFLYAISNVIDFVRIKDDELTAYFDVDQVLSLIKAETARALALSSPEVEKQLNTIGIATHDENGFRRFPNLLHDMAVKYKDLNPEERHLASRILLASWEKVEEQSDECE